MIARSEHERQVLRDGGRRLGEILAEVAAAVAPGVSIRELDQLAERLMLASGGTPAFKGYHPRHAPQPYPGVLCTSVNHEVVHGVPTRDIILRKGDLIGLDIGMKWPSSTFSPSHREGEVEGVVATTTNFSPSTGVEGEREGVAIGSLRPQPSPERGELAVRERVALDALQEFAVGDSDAHDSDSPLGIVMTGEADGKHLLGEMSLRREEETAALYEPDFDVA